MLKSVILSNALSRAGTILSVEREITRIKKYIKCIILESNRKCTEDLLHIFYFARFIKNCTLAWY